MADSDTCCGGGGLSGMKQPALSLAIGEKKIAAIEATGADTVVAGCPGCLMQIRDLLSRRGSRIQALHPMDLLAWSYEKFPRQGGDECLI
jgi:glycolate oxidase iron-sulfur subunit